MICKYCSKKIQRFEAYFVGRKAFCSLYHSQLYFSKIAQLRRKQSREEKRQREQTRLMRFS